VFSKDYAHTNPGLFLLSISGISMNFVVIHHIFRSCIMMPCCDANEIPTQWASSWIVKCLFSSLK
jgi:hypothetical protein